MCTNILYIKTSTCAEYMAATAPVSKNKYLAKSCANVAYLSDSKYWECTCGNPSPLKFKFCPYCGQNFLSGLKAQIKQAKNLAKAKQYPTSDVEWIIQVKYSQNEDANTSD